MKTILLSFAIILCLNTLILAQKGIFYEGTYKVSYPGWAVDSRDPIIGTLTLDNGNYSFIFEHNNEMMGSSSSSYPAFCIEHNKGTYLIEYATGIKENIALSKLEDNAILLTLKLISNEKEIYSALIRYNRTKNMLYFHSEKSEIELWEIEMKP